MKKILFLLIIFAAFLFESRISISGVQPNLIAAIVYFFGLKNGETKGILFGSSLGLVADGLSGGMLGPNMLGKGLVGFLAPFMSGSFFRWTPVLGMVGIALLTALDGAAVFMARAVFEHAPASISHAIFIICLTSVMNSFLGILIKPKVAAT